MKKLLILISIVVSLFLSGCSSSNQLSTGEQIAVPFNKEIKVQINGQYLLYLPEEYESQEEWPLVLFLHGAGERGTDINKVKVHGPPKLVEEGKEFPFILVSPQCPEDQYWDTDYLNALLDDIEENYNVNKKRIYVTGLSMGGYGSWAMAIKYPERFAAAAPVCGGSNPRLAKYIKHIPFWVFHGEKDKVVPVEESTRMVDALKEVDGNVKYTAYPEATHDSWTETYNNEELYKWMLEQKMD